MDINVFYQTMDDLYGNKEFGQVEPFLVASLEQARTDEDYQAYVVIGNEMISYYRSVSEFEKAYQASEDVLLLMEELQLEDSEHFATVLLNSAAAFSAGGRYRDAYELSARAAKIYGVVLAPGDARLANVYSNMSMLLDAMGETQRAMSIATEALSVIRKQPNNKSAEAAMLTNLALLESRLGKEEAEAHLLEAVAAFETNGGQTEVHYSGALAGLGEFYFGKKEYEKALKYYEKACAQVKECFGENQSYEMLSANCAAVRERLAAGKTDSGE